MNRAGEELFASSSLTSKEHARVATCGPLGDMKRTFHAGVPRPEAMKENGCIRLLHRFTIEQEHPSDPALPMLEGRGSNREAPLPSLGTSPQNASGDRLSSRESRGDGPIHGAATEELGSACPDGNLLADELLGSQAGEDDGELRIEQEPWTRHFLEGALEKTSMVASIVFRTFHVRSIT